MKNKGLIDFVRLLEKLVLYDTITREGQPVKKVRELLQVKLAPIFSKLRCEIRYFESNRHHSLLATRLVSSPSELKILFSGHADTVSCDDRWETDPLFATHVTVNGREMIMGRGTVNMKGGITALMTALPMILTHDANLFFALTGDKEIGEEDGTKVIVDYLEESGQLPDCVITADSSSMQLNRFMKKFCAKYSFCNFVRIINIIAD